MKSLLIRKSWDFFWIPLMYGGFYLFAWLPILFAQAWAHLWALFGVAINEGNSGVFSLGWLFIITFPLAKLAAGVFTLIVVWDTIAFLKNRS